MERRTTPLGQYEFLFQGNRVNSPFGAYYDGLASYIPSGEEIYKPRRHCPS